MFIYIFLVDLSRKIVTPWKLIPAKGPKVSPTSDCTPYPARRQYPGLPPPMRKREKGARIEGRQAK